jgi:phosphate starvation-inducible protein PhoH
MKSKSKKDLHGEIDFLNEALGKSDSASQGRTKKTWNQKDLKNIKALTQSQKDMIYHYLQGDNICAHGSPGTGKSFLGLYLALNNILDNESKQDNIIVVRSAVQTRDIGFLPGSESEKSAQYEIPYQDIFTDLLSRPKSYEDMKKAGLVKFVTTSFIRGVTWDNTVIVFDEIQNATFHELNSVMTRVGKDSRIILCGDLSQTDLHKRGDVSGVDRLLRIVDLMKGFENITFTKHDIVRSDFVKQWIIAGEEVK